MKVPLPITLAGHADAEIGKPVLMMAVDVPVNVSLSDAYSSKIVEDIVKLVKKETDSATDSSLVCNSPYSDKFLSVQASIIVATTLQLFAQKLGKEPPKALIQKHAYEVEKKYFKNESHAQTVTAIQGGIVYYRKEFQFYRTVFQIPGQLDTETEKSLYLYETTDAVHDASVAFHDAVERNIKRLVFAIRSENTQMVHDTLFGEDENAEYVVEQVGERKLVLTRDTTKHAIRMG